VCYVDASSRSVWEKAKPFVAALLPDLAYTTIERLLPAMRLLRVGSWDSLTRVAESPSVISLLIDPLIDNSDVSHSVSLLRRFRFVPAVAYVPLTPQSFHAIARLSHEGLYDVFVHPMHDSGRRLGVLQERLASEGLARQFLGSLGPSAGRLPASVANALTDLFVRPKPYKTAADLAIQSGVIPRNLYRRFGQVCLGSPRKLVVAAKMLRAHGYFHELGLSVEQVTDKLGYESVRVFSKHTHEVFGCCPAALQSQADGQEVMCQLLEWFHKPTPSTM